MNPSLQSAHCPVCHHTVAVPFFEGGLQPLATLGWPTSADEAKAMPRHPHDFVQCPQCSHVWNRSFSYDAIPYEKNPNRMFNTGSIWKGHLAATRDLVLAHLSGSPTVVDVGCGEGHFVRGLSEARSGNGRFLGFDPNVTPESGIGVEFQARYFKPLVDIPAVAPDVVIMRHVLEHLTDAAAFVDQLAWGASQIDKPVLFFAETPCIDRVFETNRLADFFYEHPSQFTTASFRALMERGGQVEVLSHGYDGEVIYALVRLNISKARMGSANSAAAFVNRADQSRLQIRAQINGLAKRGERVAIWGGTGKGAAFIHQFGIDADRFPIVVDSDPDKVGTFVPGTGQQIQFRDLLKSAPIDIIIIPTQWRAKDIVAEMDREGIRASQILIEHQGELIDFRLGSHPYN